MFDKHDVTTKKLDVIVEKAGKVDAVVLGKYGDGGPTAYTSVAKDMDAQYFQLDNWDELAARYSDDEIWKINEKFLDIQTSSRREIYLSHNPEEYLGNVMGDVTARRGRPMGQEARGNALAIEAMVPLAEMFGYVTTLRSNTQGRGNFTMTFDHYEEVPKNITEEIIKKMGKN